jgi:hypothetical protein
MTLARAEHSLRRLQKALRNNRSVDYCHKLWSGVIRDRDDNHCVVCGNPGRVEAHHIVRKTFFPGLRFETGNDRQRDYALCREVSPFCPPWI